VCEESDDCGKKKYSKLIIPGNFNKTQRFPLIDSPAPFLAKMIVALEGALESRSRIVKQIRTAYGFGSPAIDLWASIMCKLDAKKKK